MNKPRIGTVGDETGTKKLEYIPGSNSQFVFKEVLVDECYNVLNWNQEDVVLNIGGHVGAFDVFCFDKVKQIVSIEPYPESYKALERNLELNNIKNVITVNAAVGRITQPGRLYIGDQEGHNTTYSGIREGNSIDMGQWGIEEIFKNFTFTKIKCDCEGGEVDIFKDLIIPESVREMVFETHEFAVGVDKTNEMIDSFNKQGFTTQLIDNDHLHRTHLLVCKR